MVSTKRWYGLIANPNSVVVNYEVSPDPVYGLPDNVTVPDKKECEEIQYEII